MRQRPSLSPLFPDIPEDGPAICRDMCAVTRDAPVGYWREGNDWCAPALSDHGPDGLFVGGPEEERPSLHTDVKTGEANRAPAHETREAAYQRMDEEKRRRLRRMTLGTTGAFTGRNRRAA